VKKRRRSTKLQQDSSLALLPPSKKRQTTSKTASNHDYDPGGFATQYRRVWKIDFSMIRNEAQRVGLFYDKVLLHDGPWENEPGDDEDYVFCEDSSSNEECGDEDERDDGSRADSEEKHHDGSISCRINRSDDADSDGTNALSVENNDPRGNDFVLEEDDQNNSPIEGKGMNGKGKNRQLKERKKRSITTSICTTKNDDGTSGDDALEEGEDAQLMAVYNSFWTDENEGQQCLFSGFGGEIVGV